MAKGKMFDVKKEVPSLELCRKLKELGYPQEVGGWYWVKTKTIGKETWRVGFQIKREDSYGRMHIDYQSEFYYIPDIDVEEVLKAPTLGEMGEVLPAKIDALGDGSDWFLRIEKKEDCWYVTYGLSKLAYCVCFEKGEKLPNAYAKMLIWLAENGYLSFERKEANNA